MRNDTAGSTNLIAICPLTDSSVALYHLAVTTLLVDVYDGSDNESVRAYACVRYYDSYSSGSCGASDSTSAVGTGIDTLEPSLAEWSDTDNGYDYAYVYISLPDHDGGVVPFGVELRDGFSGWIGDLRDLGHLINVGVQSGVVAA